nr:SGNH/GDSL hydrolase family protein [Armatimonas rosea]
MGALQGCGSSGSSSPEPLTALAPSSRILFQGDSITESDRGRDASSDYPLGVGYALLIAARYTSVFPEHKLVFLNRGIRNNTVSDLAARWQRDTLELKPDILSILIGINDTGSTPLDRFEPTYDKLLEETRTALPSVRFVLMEPFFLPSSNAITFSAEWAAELAERQRLTARLAEKHRAALVSCQHLFTEASKRAPAESWLWDGIHPTDAGHQLLADAWVEAVQEAKWGSSL